MAREYNFTQGNILKALLAFTGPVLLSLVMQAMYGAVDVWVVGQFATAADVSAVSTGSQITMTVTGLIAGLSMGATVLLGQRIGAGDREGAGEAMGAAICLFAAFGAVLTVAMMALSRPLARLMQAPLEALDFTVQYIFVCSAGELFIVAYNVLGAIFRGIGDSRTPMITVAIACAFNIALDVALVAGLHWGARGAALATVVSQGVSVALSMLIIRRQKLPFAFNAGMLRFRPAIVRRILALGTPIALQDLLVGLSFLVILAIVNSLGLIASAGMGVAEKLCGFIMLVPSSFMQSMSAFVAQNVGARQFSRAKEAMRTGILLSLSVGAVIAAFAFFRGDLLCRVFTHEPEVIRAGWDYLRSYAIDTLLVSFLFSFVGYYNGLGKTTFSMVQGIIGAFCVRIPFSFLMSRVTGNLFLIGLATPSSTLVQILLCVVYWRWLGKHTSEEPTA